VGDIEDGRLEEFREDPLLTPPGESAEPHVVVIMYMDIGQVTIMRPLSQRGSDPSCGKCSPLTGNKDEIRAIQSGESREASLFHNLFKGKKAGGPPQTRDVFVPVGRVVRDERHSVLKFLLRSEKCHGLRHGVVAKGNLRPSSPSDAIGIADDPSGPVFRHACAPSSVR
jgi:hypothetical protein